MARLSKSQRLAIFLERLAAAPAADSTDRAIVLIASILNAVEDEFTDIPFQPEAFETDGRLYPPQDDARRDVFGHPDVVAFRNRGHRTYIGPNGAIVIAGLEGEIVLDKPGADGNHLEVTW